MIPFNSLLRKEGSLMRERLYRKANDLFTLEKVQKETMGFNS